MTKATEFRCRVCGLELPEKPWGEDGRSPTFNYCPCCGVEFGYGDATLKAVRAHRERWLTSGAHWSEPKERPPDWMLDEQLAHIPLGFR
jgi:hypothetical protein